MYLVTAEYVNIILQHHKSNVKLLVLNSSEGGIYRYKSTDNLLLKDLFCVYENIQIVYILFLEENKWALTFSISVEGRC